MKFFRYRSPSLKTLLGITRAKKQIKKDLCCPPLEVTPLKTPLEMSPW
jgi:hypothetical protein